LAKPTIVQVVDASVIINLIATQYVEEILDVLSEPIKVVDIVFGEIEDGRAKGLRDADTLKDLVTSNLVEVVALDATAETTFERLVSGAAHSTLDDGEAATIAYADAKQLTIGVDDKKARRICREHFPAIPLQCSGNILQHPAIEARLGKKRLAAAVLNALQGARMRVLPEQLEWVIELIGKDVAATCRSLPQQRR
jgi:predicted nucleic acid-binding protein